MLFSMVDTVNDLIQVLCGLPKAGGIRRNVTQITWGPASRLVFTAHGQIPRCGRDCLRVVMEAVMLSLFTATGGKAINFFDPSFKEFSAPYLIKVYFGLSLALLGLSWLIFVLFAFNKSFVSGILALVLGTTVGFFILIATRISCEWMLATIQTAQNTEVLVDLMSRKSSPGAAGGSGEMFGGGPVHRYLTTPSQPPL